MSKNPKEDNIISPCPHCYCMTKTIKTKCGKCKKTKLFTKYPTKDYKSLTQPYIKGVDND